MKDTDNFLESCLFFNTNALSRHLLKLGETQFKALDISPAHASLMLVLFDSPGISPKQLSAALNLTPSTISRFLNALEKKDLLDRKTKGKQAFIFPSVKGLFLKPEIAIAYKNMCLEYIKILGPDFANGLSAHIFHANQTLAGYLSQYEEKP
ncbi:MAG: MarR family transcriptional regulator [Proteobacteria bacterium]|nr:MarR family transcriptional regulator [Pseudomonadota bacterium]MBU1386573.1 MarR family transcriptional regulator [Pseudomonadota bacterium]MBU1542474.1 MarR family transcriptional regulator [Pseudomonadota bacterium]MBU2480583.1 MarR family transcriptional regulator [Pseudomonadota bacterium]